MSRIVAVVASPREEGNSNAIVDAILEGAMGLSTNIIDLYSLDGLRLVHGCRGCRVCKMSGRCAQDDEISDVLAAMREADCVVFSTPVYFAAESAQFKVLEDRMYSFIGADGKPNLDPGKRAILVVTCSGPEDAAAAATVAIEKSVCSTMLLVAATAFSAPALRTYGCGASCASGEAGSDVMPQMRSCPSARSLRRSVIVSLV